MVASMEDAVDLSKFNANVAFDRESEAAEEVQGVALSVFSRPAWFKWRLKKCVYGTP